MLKLGQPAKDRTSSGYSADWISIVTLKDMFWFIRSRYDKKLIVSSLHQTLHIQRSEKVHLLGWPNLQLPWFIIISITIHVLLSLNCIVDQTWIVEYRFCWCFNHNPTQDSINHLYSLLVFLLLASLYARWSPMFKLENLGIRAWKWAKFFAWS